MLTKSERPRLRPTPLPGLPGVGTLWWVPILLVAIYVVVISTQLGTIINHTWWSADSASAGVIGALYHHPPAGQYIVIGDHGWFEELLFYMLVKHLPAQRAIWYVAPVIFWVITIVLVAASTARAFGRYAGALVAGVLLCASPAGLMVIFQPSAHTNSLLHAAFLSLAAVWTLPRIREISMTKLVIGGILLGLFSGLPVTADTISLVWGPLPFALTVGLCAWRGPQSALTKTLVFGAVTMAAVFVASGVFGAIVYGLGLRTDQLALNATLQFAQPNAVGQHFMLAMQDLAFMVGGNFFGRALDFTGGVYLLIGLTVYTALGAVLFAVRRSVSAAGQRPVGGDHNISARMVHVSFWLVVLVAGVLMFILGSPAPGVPRYLLGPMAAVAALLPLAAARGLGWRIGVASGLSVLAIAATINLIGAKTVPVFRGTVPLPGRTVDRVRTFAAEWHATKGYAAYWDAMTLTWYTQFGVKLYEIGLCRTFEVRYCARYQVSFTDAYTPQPGIRTLFIADPQQGFTRPDRRWGKPLAHERIGRLTVYVYPYDIASRLVSTKGLLKTVITGNLPGHTGTITTRT